MTLILTKFRVHRSHIDVNCITATDKFAYHVSANKSCKNVGKSVLVSLLLCALKLARRRGHH